MSELLVAYRIHRHQIRAQDVSINNNNPSGQILWVDSLRVNVIGVRVGIMLGQVTLPIGLATVFAAACGSTPRTSVESSPADQIFLPALSSEVEDYCAAADLLSSTNVIVSASSV